MKEEQLDTLPLSAFPAIEKKELLEHFDELVTVNDLKQNEIREYDENEQVNREPYKEKYHIIHSSGSTGKPGYFVYGEKAWNIMLLGIIRAALWDMSMSQILKLLWKHPRIAYIGIRIADMEQKNMGIIKAIGFPVRELRVGFACRFGIIAVIGAVFGAIMASIFTDPIVGAIMRLAGISNFNSRGGGKVCRIVFS